MHALHTRAGLVAAGAAALSLVAACGSSGTSTKSSSTPGVTSKSILIGTQVPLTGPSASIGLDFQLGENEAVKEINAHGGINGRTIKIDYVDDASTASGGVTAAHQLVQSNNVFAVFSGATSTSAVAAVPYFRQAKVPDYESLASDARVLTPFSPYIFMGQAVERPYVAKNIVRMAKDVIKTTRLDIITASDQAFCQSGVPLVESAAKAAGVSTVGTQTFISGTTNFTAQIQQIISGHPGAVYVCGVTEDGVTFIPQLKAADPSVKVIADGTMAGPALLKGLGSHGNGIYSFWPGGEQYITDPSNPIHAWVMKVDNNFPNRPPDTPSIFAAMAYADFYDFADGLRLAGSDLTRTTFISGLEKLNGFVAGQGSGNPFSWASPIGLPRTFTTTNHMGNTSELAMKISNGTFVPVNF